ncbi:TRAP transporter substrate-binding protein [Cloacibacillus evryensis]|uniref:TRAP transporter substrate-binding protein n=1 Tax=Cloacibacillus evryensis TaxID=508460 RepID=UPI00210EE58F|nr:TRAP transporter substrate-binding protein [Cloacibacillus evryensis]MCQ4762605.1 TRAP transporter substrate-binding protein [Cloacibacillus evryensis]
MKKLLAVCIMLSLFVFTAAANAATTYKLAENQPPDYPTTVGDKEFARLVKEGTAGRIVIDVQPGGVLGDEKSVIEAVQMGGIAFARVNAQPLSDFYKPLMVFSLPFIFRDADHQWKVLDGKVGDEVLDGMKAARMVGLAYYDSGSRNIYNSKRAVKSPADLKGLKIRVQQSELMMDMIRALGASPTPMPYAEVYTGLQSGVIDGAENNWPSYYSTSHYEVAPYITLNGHTMTPEVVIVSKAIWDKLPAADQKVIKEAARKSEAVQKKAWAAYEAKSINAIKKSGKNTITQVPDKSAFQKAVQPLYNKYGAEFKDLIKKIQDTK